MLKQQRRLYLHRKKKLKLGRIVFDFLMVSHLGINLWYETSIRNVGQDTTDHDEMQLDAILKRQGWKWDAKNVLALCTLALIGLVRLWIELDYAYREYFPALAYRTEHHDFLLQLSFDEILVLNIIEEFQSYAYLNFQLSSAISDFCIYFNIIF